MSGPFAIAAVTRTLAGLLEAALQAEDPSYRVTNLPPDRSNAETEFANRLNLFLVQPTHNAVLRNTNNVYAAVHGASAQPPLAINLTYMITTYGEATPDTNDQRILGLAMQFLNDHPVLLADDIRNAFPGTGLENQAEHVRITPRDLSLEEMSRMWASFMTQYRTSAAYEVSVVLVDSTVPAPADSPILRRGDDDRGASARAGLPPVLTAARPPELLRRGLQVTYQPAIRLDEVLTLEGERLPVQGAALEVRSFAWRPRSARFSDLAPGPRRGTLQATLSAPPPETPPPGLTPLAWAPGVYTAALIVADPSGRETVSNAVPFALAPRVTIDPTSAAPGDVQLTVGCLPAPRADQTVLLLLSGREPIEPDAITSPVNPDDPATITFTAASLTVGNYLVRLRVDGVDSVPYRTVGIPGGGTALEQSPSEVLVVA